MKLSLLICLPLIVVAAGCSLNGQGLEIQTVAGDGGVGGQTGGSGGKPGTGGSGGLAGSSGLGGAGGSAGAGGEQSGGAGGQVVDAPAERPETSVDSISVDTGPETTVPCPAGAGSDVVCGEPSCRGSTYSPAPRCDGHGNCKAAAAESCDGNLRCQDGSSCRVECTSDNQCVAGHRCDLSSRSCKPNKPLGASCDPDDYDDGGCASGHCVDGVCCGSPCTGLCNACSLGKTGLPDGKCGPVKVGQDPDGECRREDPSSCGQDGACDGSSGCRKYVDGSTCATSCCDSGPGRGARPCNHVCRSGRCDNDNPVPQESCGALTCCCPTGGAGGAAACVSSILGCPAGCQ